MSLRTDKNEKFAEYRFVDSFTEYLIVEQSTMEAILHRKGEDGVWTTETYTDKDDCINLESGCLGVDGAQYQVRKHGLLSGKWTLEAGEQTMIVAQKPDALFRRFELGGAGFGARYQLGAESCLSRVMHLEGPGHNCVFSPNHPFTRRASITGKWQSFELVAFSFWLVGLTWKRMQNNNSG